VSNEKRLKGAPSGAPFLLRGGRPTGQGKAFNREGRKGRAKDAKKGQLQWLVLSHLVQIAR
jgi:hypothetical protein